ncbi:MAG: hypothetical protein SOZ40_02470 [Ezakiella sp.]|nr:hypothetical protein [Ezakiella sp.]MDY3946855.1 hypothetical protein [Ezakiella sp.]
MLERSFSRYFSRLLVPIYYLIKYYLLEDLSNKELKKLFIVVVAYLILRINSAGKWFFWK